MLHFHALVLNYVLKENKSGENKILDMLESKHNIFLSYSDLEWNALELGLKKWN